MFLLSHLAVFLELLWSLIDIKWNAQYKNMIKKKQVVIFILEIKSSYEVSQTAGLEHGQSP